MKTFTKKFLIIFLVAIVINTIIFGIVGCRFNNPADNTPSLPKQTTVKIYNEETGEVFCNDKGEVVMYNTDEYYELYVYHDDDSFSYYYVKRTDDIIFEVNGVK